jgi:hypothetical protein
MYISYLKSAVYPLIGIKDHHKSSKEKLLYGTNIIRNVVKKIKKQTKTALFRCRWNEWNAMNFSQKPRILFFLLLN